MQRRSFLACTGTVTLGSLAGCLGPSSAGKRPLARNPVGQGLDRQPRLGLPRDETGRTLVSFQTPTCANCAAFHDETFPEIREQWVERGEATVYARNAQVRNWAVAAANALEETRLRVPDLYWVLKSRYYENRVDVTKDNVVDKTRSFLADEEIDADAVARAATTRPHSDAIELDESAFAEGVRIPATPTTWMFEDGEFVTILGNQSFEAFVSAVESHE